MKIRPNILWILLVAISISACKKFVSINPSNQLITTDAVFSNDNTALSAVDGIYVQLRTATPSMFNGGLSIYGGLSADDIFNTSASTNYDPFYQNLIPSTNGTIGGIFWSSPYNIIYRTNAILDGLNNSAGVSSTVKNQLIGEVKFIRAFAYFYLTNLYGDVPLVLTKDYQIGSLLPRAPVADIFKQIISDLVSSQSLMGSSYPSQGKLRPNAMVATALLSRVYLYQKDWTNAMAQSSAVINSNNYSLLTDLTKVFLINSQETIWEIASPSEIRNSAEGSTFLPASATVKPAFAISNYLINSFEIGDKRKVAWLGSNTVSGTVYHYPSKFKNRTTTSITEYDVAFRLAEQYLIRAESEANLNQLTQAVADLNQIRTRAGLTLLSTSLSQSQIINATFQERRVELFAEWGHRWFDLKRSGLIDAILSAEKNNWQSYKALFPLPNLQIIYNGNLKQNPNY
ncbi:RagB/SusD family nutrient uptake outer membrane protein [Mucilaginibacter agri]|uniref:RagB/SusD family nutrient uptake outer membrane protein n=1 Tax=Mucilaginibacter agri TaxID=2695265 RepID=A0A965ZD96_9SPHI|nr:RagB/SusD family nutrient uptake outer membrane protein [Mucilaginibacter agri]NCD68585.1 RagB/SusD family nutrient uptake outer membrane protein [Mucilaginibacter agri]